MLPLLNAEQLEDYGPGGLHPVHIGDELQDSRYKIVRKLGHGAFSTVWLARDASSNKFVAMKIKVAQSTHVDRELHMHRTLLDRGDAAQECIVTLLDSFEHFGPNGTHLCLVFETMGPDITTLFGEDPGARRRLPYDTARQAVKRLLTGLYYLHDCRIAYGGDINFGNLLVSIDDSEFAAAQREDLEQPMSKMHSTEQQSPRYICEDLPLTEYLEDSYSVKIKLSDLGSAFPFHDPPERPIVPVALRAPELILGLKFDHRIDVWSFGCIAFELLAGTPLFAVAQSPVSTEDETNDGHLLSMASTLGPLPPALFAQWPRGQRYFNEEMKLIRSNVVDDSGEVYVGPDLEIMFLRAKPPEMTMTEARSFIRFLKRALRYEASDRPPISQLMQDSWIKDIDVDL